MKKTTLVILMLLLLLFSACGQLIDAVMENEQSIENSTDLKTIQPQNTENEALDIYGDGPNLPNLDFSNMDLFEDGYQTVYFDHAPDGDTAIFIVGDSYLKTRFLSVDTKEMSTDSGIPEPWAQQAADFTEYMLNKADEIILELDDNSDIFDDYDRLLAWIWVDGMLLNYMLAESGYADVRYLYDDYKYNDYLLDAEYRAQNRELGIWGNDDPYFNPNDYMNKDNEEVQYITIKEARSMDENTSVQVKGIVTSKIGNNAFVQDDTGGIYVYIGSKSYSSLIVGNEIAIKGKIANYNGLLELVEVNESDIRILSSENKVDPKLVTLEQIDEHLESQLIIVQNAKITFVDYQPNENGYTIFIEQNGVTGEIRIDKYLESFPAPEDILVDSYIDVIGNVAQHHNTYQIMISSKEDIIIN